MALVKLDGAIELGDMQGDMVDAFEHSVISQKQA
jgi:hypothetical protein